MGLDNLLDDLPKDGERAFLAAKVFLREHEEFSYYEIEKYVIEVAGTVRFAPGRRLQDWIEDLKALGIIIEYAPFRYRKLTEEEIKSLWQYF